MARRDQHIDPVDLVAYRQGDLAVAQRGEVEDHLSSCQQCSAELVLVDDSLGVAPGSRLEQGRSERMEAAFSSALKKQPLRSCPRSPSLWRRRVAPALVLAASLVLMVVGGTRLWMQDPPLGPGSELRGSGSSLEILAENAGGAVELSWSPVATADSYELSVLDRRGQFLLQRTVTATGARILASDLPAEHSGLALRVVARAGQRELARQTVALSPTPAP